MPALPEATAPATGDRRPRADAQRNVESILEAARAVLSREPTAGLQRIAEASGVHRATVYRHFVNREALVQAVYARYVDRLGEAISQIDPAGEPVVELRRLSERALRLTVLYPPFGYAPLLPPGGEEDHRRIRSPLVELFERGQAAGVFRGDMRAGTVAGSWGYNLPFVLARLNSEEWTVDEAVDFLVRLPCPPGP